MDKLKLAESENDKFKAADLQFYAIPDLRARVEDLRAQQRKVRPSSKPSSGHDPSQEPDAAAGRVAVERKEEIDDMQTTQDVALGGPGVDSEGSDHGTKDHFPRENGKLPWRDSAERVVMRGLEQTGQSDNHYGPIEINRGLVRRPTTATVEDVSDVAEDFSDR